MDFKAFGKSKPDGFAAEARAAWGGTDAYREYEDKSAGRTAAEEQAFASDMMELFAGFGAMKDSSPGSPEVQAQVAKLRDFISEHYYRCTDEILAGLGAMYAAGGDFTVNIDAAGGEGTAVFASRAIKVFCGKRRLNHNASRLSSRQTERQND